MNLKNLNQAMDGLSEALGEAAVGNVELARDAEDESRTIANEAERRLKKNMMANDVHATMGSAANIMSRLARIAKTAGLSDVEEAIWKAVESIEKMG